MGASALVLALTVLLSAQSEEPQLVVLPLEAEGVKAQLGLDAWKTVVAEVAKAKAKLKVGVSFQKELHDMLLGPARDQARDCGANLDCLRDIGRALDVGQLIAGKVTKDEVSLVALDILTGQKLGTGKSPSNLAKSKVEAKSKAATQALVSALTKAKKGGAPAVAATEDPKGEKVASKEPLKQGAGAGEDPTPAIGAAGNGNGGGGGEEDLKDDTRASEAPSLPGGSGDAKLHIASASLAGINEVTLDGAPLSRDPDGGITWIGTPGTRALAFARADGTRETRDVTLQPGQTSEVALDPPRIQETTANANPAATSTNRAPVREEESVTSKWWFWTAIATAVLAGGATTVVLAGGLKGGPSVPDNSGTIFGTY